MTTSIRLALVGLGNVGRAFLDLMGSKAETLRQCYDLELILTGVADSGGALIQAQGISASSLRAHKSAGRSVADYPGGVRGMGAADMVEQVSADVLLEAAAVNLKNGQPGLDCTRIAIQRGMAAVLADKGPMVHAFDELTAAASQGRGLAYSATVCGALPVVNIGRRDLVGCQFARLRGIFNSTSNYILGAMAQGESYTQALHQAQIDGVAEADPTLDVEGWDTANKLVIIANSILRQPASLADVTPVTGITQLAPEEIRKRAAQGEVVKLVASADWYTDHYKLSVEPEWLPAHDFLAQVNGWEMGIVFETDIMGVQQFKVNERGPVPTAAAMLRDVVNLTRGWTSQAGEI